MTTVPVADDGFDAFLDDLFLGCAFAAYVEQARRERRSPPDSEATRERAYGYYEEALASKNAAKSSLPEPGPLGPKEAAQPCAGIQSSTVMRVKIGASSVAPSPARKSRSARRIHGIRRRAM